MAGRYQRNQSKKSNRQNDRLGPGIGRNSSRVSKVVGGLGSQSVRVEQRSSSPATRQSSRGTSSSRRAQGSKQGAKKGSSPRGNRPAYTPSPPNGTADSRVIDKARDAWGNLKPHHQQRVLSILLLLMALFLFAVLTVFRTVPLFGPLGGAFIALFGWSAYLFAIGLIAFAIAHLIEGMQNKKLIRWSFVVGLVLLWLILLVESQLLLKGKTGGFLGGLLVRPLLGWPEVVGHILLIGLFGVITIVTFQITLGHVLQLGQALRFMASPGQKAAGNTAGSSQYRGQRPRFSRYGSGLNGQQGQVSPDVDAGGAEDEEGLIDFEADFGDEHDPLNDINIHKQQISRFPRGSRPAEPLDAEEHSNAVQGVKQQALPFNQAAKAPEQKYPTMEPLAPNPLRKNLSKVLHRGAAQGSAAASESPWKLPDTSLLNNPEEVKLHFMGDDTTTLAKLIQDTLRSFRIEADVRPEDISVGPTVIRFGIRPTGKPAMKLDEKGKPVPIKDASGNIVYEMRTRVSRIMALQNDLALVLEAKSIRMEAPVPGRPYVGVEIPNKNSRLVTLREVLESKEYQAARAKSKIAIALGKDVAGAVRVGDLARMPHLLIAGATGAGKSVCINAIVASILSQATPEDVRLLMVDPKMVELIMYNGIPHLLAPVVTEVEKVVGLLKRAITEMERRYRLFSKLGVRNLDGYRKLRAERISHGDSSMENLPAIVIIIDELADLMMAAPEEVEGMICRLAQLARATGIHLVIATQRPSVDVITGLIKANIPTRISFMVSSSIDSRTIIDMGGAERLLGRGDMLYLPADAGKPERIQGAFLADDEAEKLIAYWRQEVTAHAAAANRGQPAAAPPPEVEPGWEITEHVSDDFELEDDLLEKAEEVVREYERASISLLQRRLRIGYSRAARLIDLLEERGVIGSSEVGGRSREVLDGGNGSDRHGSGGEGRTMADEVADIIAEEKAREEFLKKQGAAGNLPPQGYSPSNGAGKDDEMSSN
ncbi:MAG: DNA translocase FtsK [Ktedonobacteraceae bacterium]